MPTATWSVHRSGAPSWTALLTPAVPPRPCPPLPHCRRYGDLVRSGWRNIMDCVMRLHRLELLPPAVIAMDAEDQEEVGWFPRLLW